MKLSINISFKAWRTWFEVSTVGLAFALLLLTTGISLIDDHRIGLDTLLCAINWLIAVLVGLRKY